MQQPNEKQEHKIQIIEEPDSQDPNLPKDESQAQSSNDQVQSKENKQQQKLVNQIQEEQKPAQKQSQVQQSSKIGTVQQVSMPRDIAQNKQQNQQIPSKDKDNQQSQSASKNQQKNQKRQEQPDKQQKHQNPIDVSSQAKNLDIVQTQSKIGQEKQVQQIRLLILDEIQVGSTLLGSLVYRISGFDRHGKIEINRKFSQFQALRKILQQRWPGCFIPSLSDKSQIKNGPQKKSFKFRWMQHFLMGLAQSPFMYYKEQIQLFLRSPGVDYKEMFDQMPSLKAPDIIQRFKSCFGEDVQKPSVLSNGVQISNLSTSLKKVLHNLGELSKQTLTLADSFDNYKLSLQKATEFFYNYQTFALSQYIQNDREKTLLIKDQQNRVKNLSQLQGKNIYYQMYQNIEFQAKDAQAFLDIILAMQMFTLKRDQLENSAKQTQLQIDQIALGHKSMKVMASRKTKQQIQTELETKHKQLMSQKLIVVELFNITQIVLASKSTPIFKQYKTGSYQNLIRKWCEIGNQVNPQMANIWKFVNQESKQLHSKYIKQQ